MTANSGFPPLSNPSERPDNGRRPPASSLACQNSPVRTDLVSDLLPSGECRLKAAKPYPHLRRAILLQLYTGSRPGVVLALRWDQIDFKAGIMHRVPIGTTQDEKKRSPRVRLGRRITAHLKRWRRLD